MKDYELIIKMQEFCNRNNLRLPEVTIYPCYDKKHADSHAEIIFHLEFFEKPKHIMCPTCYRKIDVIDNTIKEPEDVETTTQDVETTTQDVETTTQDVETTTQDVETTTQDVAYGTLQVRGRKYTEKPITTKIMVESKTWWVRLLRWIFHLT